MKNIPSQVVVLSNIKLTSELFKKLLEKESIKTLALDDYTDFAHFMLDLNAELLLVDLKMTKVNDFEASLKKELRKIPTSVKLVFFGTDEEWNSNLWTHNLGAHLKAPIQTTLLISKISEFFPSNS